MRLECGRITYYGTGSRLECPCGVSNTALLWHVDRNGTPVLGPLFLVECQVCGRRMTADGAVVSRKETSDA